MNIVFKSDFSHVDRIQNKDILYEILKTRNVENESLFLKPSSPLEISLKDFGYEKEIQTTIKILEKIKEKNQTVVVYTDYDADGITGGAILWETLNLLGFNVKPYVPHRKNEGYGFSIKGIDTVKKDFDPALDRKSVV